MRQYSWLDHGSTLTRNASERPEDNFFLKTQGVVPLKTEFKPAMKVLSRKPAPKSAGPARIGQLSLDDDDDEEDDSGKSTLTPEERIAKAQREREEKQKAYEERRRELFGEGEGSPATSTTPKKDSNSRNHSRATRGNESRPSSSASNKTRHLYDPNESAKPESLRVQKKEPVPGEIQPIREPKAPDGSGRGGFGFAPRGCRGNS